MNRQLLPARLPAFLPTPLQAFLLRALGALLVLSGAANSQVLAPAPYSPFAVAQPNSVTVGDVYAVGTTQMVIAGSSTVTIVSCTNTTCTKSTPANVGSSPVGVAIGDYNGDGRPDLAVANSGSDNVTILLQNSDTSFSQATGSPIAVGTAPTGIVAGDFNGDGKLDLVVSNSGSADITVLLGNGDGTFHNVGSLAVGNTPYALAVADLNKDGKLDLAVANQADATLSILLGNGAGGFVAAPGSPITVATTPKSIAIADFNGDGNLDLAFTGGSATANVLIGKGDGTFSADPFGSFPVASSPTHIAVGDVDGDGNLDLVVTSNSGNGAISVLLGQGNGGFFPALGSPFTGSVAHPYNWDAVGDVNGDGKLDVEAVSTDGLLTVLLNVGSLTATPVAITFNAGAGQTTSVSIPVHITKVSGSNTLYSATATQNWMTATPGTSFTPDTLTVSANPLVMSTGVYHGKVVLSGAQNGDGLVGVTLNIVNPSGTLLPLFGSPYTAGGGPRSIAAADFNGDGKPDLAVANSTDGIVTILLSNGAGGFTPGSAIISPSVSAVAAADLNGDGKIDLAVTNSANGTVSILLGNGQGGFTASPGGPYTVGVNPTQIVVGDFNNDGRPDLMVANTQLDTLLVGTGGGGFERGPALNCSCVGPLTTGDFNGDGFIDIAAVNAAGAVQILFGTESSAGVFSTGLTISGITNPVAIVAADFNADGKLDIATLNSDGTVSLALGNGQGGFGTPATTAGVAAPGALVAADFNGDGKIDLAATNAAAAGGVTILLGNGAGGLTPTTFATGSQAVAAVAADFNGDGRPDLATANFLGDNVTVLMASLTPVSATLTAPTSAMVGQTVNLSTQIAITGNVFAVPGGTVTFKDGSTVLQTVNLVNGAASYSTSFTAGSHTLSAVYSGDTRTMPAVSNSVTLAVVGPPLLTVTKSHSGPFVRGQQNATYTVTVGNSANSLPTSGTVTVTDTIPAGLILVSMAGMGWTCPATLANNCTRSDALNGGSTYPPITVTVNVSSTAPSQLTNQVSASGGGSTTVNTSDVTAVMPSTHPPGDFDGNGVPDILLQFPDGSTGIWYTAAAAHQVIVSDFAFAAGPATGFSVVDTADLNGDGVPDLILQFSDSSIGVWYMGGPKGNQIQGFSPISGPLPGWKPVAMADLNGDGHPDMIIQFTDGTTGVWYLGGVRGSQILGFALISYTIPNMQVVGAADLNQDGQPDIIMQFKDGSVGVWFMGTPQGNVIQGFGYIAGPSPWSVVGVVPMDAIDGDTHPDLVIRHPDGTLGVWYLGGSNGTAITGFCPLTVPGNTNWKMFAAH